MLACSELAYRRILTIFKKKQFLVYDEKFNYNAKISYSVVNPAVEDRPSLVFIHDFPLNHKMWKEQWEYFGSNYGVILPDLRGFGGSLGGENYSDVKTWTADLEVLFDYLKIKRAVLIGGFLGGCVAFDFYQHYPKRVEALVLVNPRASSDVPDEKRANADIVDSIFIEGETFATRYYLSKFFTSEDYNQRPKLIKATETLIEENDFAGIGQALEGLTERPDYSLLLKHIEVPTLVITSTEDTMVVPEASNFVASQIPNAVHVVMREAGHLCNMEKPKEFNQILEKFLKELY